MRVGVGLPGVIPGMDGRLIAEFARRAERGPFTSVGVLDRPPYGGLDPFISLAAAAAVTERIGLVTMVVIGPLRATALLAKQAASVHSISGGRLTLGLGIGARRQDYERVGVSVARRGRRLTEQVVELRRLWEEGRVSPDGSPMILTGGLAGEAFARAARYADGYVHGGGPPRAFAGAVSRAMAAWEDAERPGRPALWGQAYFALGDEDVGADYLRHYYAFTGPFAEKVVAANLTSPQAITDFLRGYEEAGCDEMVLLPTVADPEQIDRLAKVLE